jgi:hypothetical protein
MAATHFRWSFLPLILSTVNPPGTLAQGTVWFANHWFGGVSRVYMPSPASPGLMQTGNGPSDDPPGTTDWTGWTPVTGSAFSAQLFGIGGANAPADSLRPAGPITTFQSGPDAGIINSVLVTLTDAPGPFPATVQMRVWDNKGGAITDWATALAQPPGTEILGTSGLINLPHTGAGLGASPPNLVGLQSFNLAYNVPEPCVLALVGVGGVLLRFVRPRKRPASLSTECKWHVNSRFPRFAGFKLRTFGFISWWRDASACTSAGALGKPPDRISGGGTQASKTSLTL